MGTKIYTFVFLFFVLNMTMFSTCRKGGFDCANTVYTFQIGEQITPDKDSIRVGDTLVLKMTAPTNLTDMQSGRTISYGNAENLGNIVTFLRLFPMNQSYGAMKNFTLSVIKGRTVNTVAEQGQLEVLFSEENEKYVFDLLIVPRDTGRYAITIGNAANVYRKNDKCTKASFEIDFQNTDQHFYFLQLWRPDLTLDERGKRKVYYFKVI